MICTIYILKNTKNNKVYIGQTWASLKKRAGKNGINYKKNILLYNAILKYGFDSFYYEVLTFCSNQDVADFWENYFIVLYDSINRIKGYNLTFGGSAGLKSEYTKKRMSKAQKGRTVSYETKKKLSLILLKDPIRMLGEENPMFGKIGKDHHFYGKHHSDEAKKKISESKKGKISPRKGKKMSEESKKKMSIAKKGKNPPNKGKKMNKDRKYE